MKKTDFFTAAEDRGALRGMFELLGAREHALLQTDSNLRVTAMTEQAELLLGAAVLSPLGELLGADTVAELRRCVRDGCGAELGETIDEAPYRLRVRPLADGLLLAVEPAYDVYRTALGEFQRQRIQSSLAVIMLATRQIAQGAGDMSRYADVIRHSGLAIRRVLLHSDALSAPRAALSPSLAWNDLAALCRRLAEQTACAAAVTVHTELPDNLFASYDERLVIQAVCNLLTNACAAPGVHTVTLRLTSAGKEALLSVADDGQGIPERALPRLFTGWSTMESASSTLADHAEGVSWGLGLPLTQKIAEAHEGRLFWREDPAGGCVFTLALPIGCELPYALAQPSLMVGDGFDIAEIELSALPR